MQVLTHTQQAHPLPLRSSAASADWSAIYDRYAELETPFAAAQLDAMALRPHHTVLDVGCGSGRLALPMARRVRSVTALDRDAPLLRRLGARAADEAISNIVVRQADWDEIEPPRDIGRHDIVVASRFTGAADLMKLDAAAHEAVFVLMFSGPSTRALHDALLEGIAPPAPETAIDTPGFVRLFNELAAAGLDANVLHLPDGFTRRYPSEDAAFADFDWLAVKPELRFLLRRNLGRFLWEEEGGARFLFPTRSTLVWWRK